jgi:UDP-N-acetylglucosamine transferase subunit ALG13
MILVLLGTNYFSFDRLVKEVDDKISLNYNIEIQIGRTTYLPKNCKYYSYLSRDEIIERMKEAELIITQGGYGSMMDAILLRKKIIAVPRKVEFNECLDNQAELVNYFAKKKYIVACDDINKLEGMVQYVLSGRVTFDEYQSESKMKIKDMINKDIESVLNVK